ncbi:MAG: SIR2 family protein [Alphaproteobacteria bacterium]|nr:SIR2 family protein [Alphaproteobacteria bacterium]
MPELIQDGPDIPVELMNRRDDGKVVFFCGSGISVSTGLPMFDGLVSQIYEHTAQTPTELEDGLRKKGQLDKVLGQLEGRLNPGRLRREAISILSTPPPESSLVTHQALLHLSRHADHGIRLVTTNFDDRFELADPSIAIDGAPKLPLPKPHGWGSLVHLHGRITAGDADGQDLVLTAADFGRAYLTERWASRFITELFREFTIVFVGYSLDDPVMSYMVDALAAERSRGARFQEAYAFADFKDGDEGRRRSDLAWQGKNVTPILFDAQDGFGKLTDTLVKWADISRDPIKSRRQIVFDELRNLPANENDPIAQRVTWALSDKPTAEALAEAAAIIDEEDFPILAGWIDVFDEAGLLSRPSEILADGSARRTPIVGNAYTQNANNSLDDISTRLASWLAKHIHIPQVLGWAARKGGHLHPYFRDQVRRHLSEQRGDENKPPEISERLRLLWTILVQNTPVDYGEDFYWERLIENAASDAERALVERAFIASVRPHLTVLPGPSMHVRSRPLYNDDPTPLTPLEECAHLKLSAGEHWRDTRFDQAPFKENFLASHAFTITEHLRHAVLLLSLDEAGFSLPWFYRPAIEEHGQNRNRDDWTFLIDWARDGYFALAKRNPLHADILVRIWVESDIPLLHRLALHVLTEDSNADIRAAIKLLLSGDPANVWSIELHHEVMVFLRKVGQRLPAEALSQLVKTIKPTFPRWLPNSASMIAKRPSSWNHKLRFRLKGAFLAAEARSSCVCR